MVIEAECADRVIITGAGGVLGTALRQRLATVPHLYALQRQDCDLLDRDATMALWRKLKPNLVFHLAGWVAGVQGNLSNAGRAFYENSQINLNVIEASREVGVSKVVAAGTTAVYSDDAPRPMRENDIWIGAPHGSERAYAHSKRAMLAQLEAYQAQYGLSFCYMICTNLYGPNDRFDERFGHVVPSLISRFERAQRENRDEIVIWGDGTPTRDFVFADDAASAFVAAAAAGEGAYNVATGTTVTIRGLVDTLADVFDFSGRIVWDTSKPSGQLQRSYCVDRLTGMGWSPQTSLRDGLGATAEWYRANRASARR